MATRDRAAAGEPRPAEKRPAFDREKITRLAEGHLADLIETHRATQLELDPLSWSRFRSFGRWFRRDWRRLALRWQRLVRAARSPRYALGRRLAWWRLLVGVRRDWAVVGALAVVLLLVLQERAGLEIPQSAWYAIGAVFGVSAAGAVLFLWQDFVLCPFRAWRIRRDIRKHPTHVLPTAPRPREARLIPREDPLEGRLIPRHDLYDEVIPGILRKHHRDIQIIVGEPGSGKTTALVGLAGMLARVGIVPVLVPLRGQAADDIVGAARKAFERQLDPQVRSASDIDVLWRWLRRRKRVAILTDDIDQIGPDAERGFVLRTRLEDLATKDLPIVVTARPAGIPAGVAASSIDLGALEEGAVVDYVREVAERDPGAGRDATIDERGVAYWVREGRLTEAPFYLELLASLYATGGAPELPAAIALAEQGESGCFRRLPDGSWAWNPLWVRFRLLERYYEEIKGGRVRRWLGIEVHERASTLEQLERAALGMLRAGAQEAQARADEDAPPKRKRLEEFIDPDDRAGLARLRSGVSPHEVVDTGERLRILERDGNELQFRHRIMQAYLAGRCLVRSADATMLESRVKDLVDRRQPEKLTAHMALTFAALCDHERQTNAARANGGGSMPVAAPSARDAVLAGLLAEASKALPEGPALPARNGDGVLDVLDPREECQLPRTDPDDALINLTAAAEIARATDRHERGGEVCDEVGRATGATRWTKLGAIGAIGGLEKTPDRWRRIWEYARDPDYKVRRAASDEIQKNAEDAYAVLRKDITHLILRAAARSALGLPMLSESPPLDGAAPDPNEDLDIYTWREKEDIWALMALGWILPAIVSGLREDSSLDWSRDALDATRGRDGHDVSSAKQVRHAEIVRDARHSLDWLVALAFKGGQHNFEASVAQGFKGDAMRHAEDPDGRISGPGWVASNRRLVADVCLGRAEFWYSRMLLHQALALYAIAGANRQETYDVFARYLTPGRERHAFVLRAAMLARRAVERNELGSDLWKGQIWRDEGEVVGRRATALDDSAAQLVADVTLLTNLNERSGEDRQAQFGHMRELPYCLAHSHDRNEILGAGCPPKCGWGLCPYSQPPVDEPNAHRGVSRAFCRQQQMIANRRRPRWQRTIRKRALEEFWWDMERRART